MSLVPVIPVLLSAPAVDGAIHHLVADVSVLESALHDGICNIVVRTRDLVPRPPPPPPRSFLARLRNRMFKPAPSRKEMWMETQTLYRLTLPTTTDPVLRWPTLISTFCWPQIYVWDSGFATITSTTASGYGIRWAPTALDGMLNHMARITFQRLQEGVVEQPATQVADDLHDTRSTSFRLSETGIVMLQHATHVVLYWYK
ncbi:hypothetical protein C8R46DRAFT_467123 [Mycena filopes]|nr:hypothetical protein C8R46DRAFT_467123 [Mycena filopes]